MRRIGAAAREPKDDATDPGTDATLLGEVEVAEQADQRGEGAAQVGTVSGVHLRAGSIGRILADLRRSSGYRWRRRSYGLRFTTQVLAEMRGRVPTKRWSPRISEVNAGRSDIPVVQGTLDRRQKFGR